MKYFTAIFASAAILAVAPSIAVSGPVMQRAPTSHVQMSPHLNMKILHNCKPGFNKSSYAGGSSQDFQCMTPYIKCPGSGNKYVLSFTNPQPVVNNGNGVRFAYVCDYQETPK